MSAWDVAGATSLRCCEDVSFDTRRTNQIETYWRRIQIISYVKNISHFICSKYQPLERFRWMPRKNTQRPIDVVKTSVWDVVGTTSLGRCEDVPFNTGRTDQFETYWRRPWDVVCLLGRPLPSADHTGYGKPFWFLAATKQLYEWFSPSLCLSVRPSVSLSVTHF